MTSEGQNHTHVETQFDDVVLSYLEAAEVGPAPAPGDVIARHPHLAAELKAFFANAEYLDPIVAPFRDLSTEPPLPEPLPRPFGEYELLAEIGCGGMGVVYRASQRGLNRDVALKKIRHSAWAAPDVVQRLRREAENVAKLEHPNIVKIIQVGEHQGEVFFSMQLVEGASLDKHLKAFAVRPQAAAQLLAVIARAVHYAHQRQILHRDLKPANILLEYPDADRATETDEATQGNAAAPHAKKATAKREGREGLDGVRAFVTDFGLACRLDDAAAAARARLIEGTASYMAPEQAGGEGVSTAADVYGLGAVLYEVLTGQPPFRGKDLKETLVMVREKAPTPPRTINRKADRDLEAVCLKCLQKDPAARYETAKDVADDLQRYLDRRPVKARRVGRVERAALWARRRPAVAALAAAVMLVALLGVGGVLWKWWDAVAFYEAQEAVLYINRINLAQKQLEDGQASLAEKQLKACPLALQAWEWNYLKNLSRCDRIVLTGHTGRVVAVQYSPDGSMLATGGQDGAVKLWNAATGELLRTLGDPSAAGVAHPGGVAAVCFSERSGKLLLVSAGEDQAVRVWDTATGEMQRALPNKGHLVAGSCDGKRFASVGQDAVVRIWDADDGPDGPFRVVHAEDLREQKPLITGIALSSDGRRLAVCGFSGLVKVWEEVEGTWHARPLPAEASLGSANVWAAAFSADGTRLAVGGPQPFMWRMDERNNSISYFAEPGDKRCGALAFSPDGALLAGTFRDGLVRMWNITGGTIAFAPGISDGHSYGHSFGVAFSPDGNNLALAWKAEALVEAIKMKPLAGGRVLASPGAADISALAFNRDGLLACRAGDQIVLADPRAADTQPQVKVGDLGAGSSNLAFSRDGLLFSGRVGEPVWVWDAVANARAAVTIPATDVRCCAVSDDGRTLATTKGDNGVDVWDLPEGKRRCSLRGGGDIKALAFRPGRAQLASCGDDGQVHLWDATTGKEVRTFIPGSKPDTFSKAFTALAFSTDGSRIAAAGLDLTVCVWNSDDSSRVVCWLEGHYGCITGLAFSPDGRRIASCATDGKVKLWDAVSGREVLTLSGHKGPVEGVAFNRDGSLLATCGRDGTVRIWDAPLPHE